jgi:hypothetical protein
MVRNSEWLAPLLESGLLRGSFIPPSRIRDLRDLTGIAVQHMNRQSVTNAKAKVLGDIEEARVIQGADGSVDQHDAAEASRKACVGRERRISRQGWVRAVNVQEPYGGHTSAKDSPNGAWRLPSTRTLSAWMLPWYVDATVHYG